MLNAYSSWRESLLQRRGGHRSLPHFFNQPEPLKRLRRLIELAAKQRAAMEEYRNRCADDACC